MTTQSFKGCVAKLETWLVRLLALYLLGASIPVVGSFMNIGSYGILPILLIRRWKRLVYVATRDILLVLLVGLTIASIFWSAAPESSSAEIRPFIRATLFGIYVAAYYSPKEQMRLWGWALGVGAILSFVVAIATPSVAIHENGAWHGVFSFKNYFASIMTLAAILFLLIALDSQRKRWVAWTGFLLAVVLVLLSLGKTAYAIFFILLCLLPLYKFIKQQYKLRVFLLLVALLLGGSVIVLLVSNLEFIVVDTLGKDIALNGRMPIWTLALDKVFERPWFGYGFVGFWDSSEADYVLYNTWAGGRGEGFRFNAHSGYIELLLYLGFVGFSLYLLGFITVFLRVIYLLFLTPTMATFWMLQALVGLLFFNLTDYISTVSEGGAWSLYVSIIASTAIQKNRIKQKHLLKTHANRPTLNTLEKKLK